MNMPSTQLLIHIDIMKKLQYFYDIRKIPNILFHGQSGIGKRTIVSKFINIIYNNDKDKIKTFVMYVNCAHGKGIKFIREELKFFAKTHIHSNGGDIFKSIILLNADKLTIDAQSTLRRCIELFNHTTRFFIVVEDKYKMLKPILSRFCEIYVPEPILKDRSINLYRYNLGETFKLRDIKTQRSDWLKKELAKYSINGSIVVNKENILDLSTKLYEKAYSGIDIIQLLENTLYFTHIEERRRFELLFAFNKVRKEFRSEKMLILFILNFLFMSLDCSLENISFM